MGLVIVVDFGGKKMEKVVLLFGLCRMNSSEDLVNAIDISISISVDIYTPRGLC